MLIQTPDAIPSDAAPAVEPQPGTWSAILDALSGVGARLLEMMPNLVAAAALLLVGFVVSWVVEIISRRVLRRFGIDEAAARLAPGERKALTGTTVPSKLISKVVFWILMLTFVLSAAEVMGFETLTDTVGRLVSYLPNVVAAGLLLLVGVLLARVVNRLVTSAASAAGIGEADRLGAAARVGVIVLVLVLALGQLGVETRVLVTVLAVVLAGSFITVGLAFGLGARPLVTHILAGHFLRKTLPSGHSVEVDGRRGTIERVGAVETRFRDDDGGWSVPNARLLDEVITHD